VLRIRLTFRFLVEASKAYTYKVSAAIIFIKWNFNTYFCEKPKGSSNAKGKSAVRRTNINTKSLENYTEMKVQ
jgi:hypothetical protein